MTEPFAITTPSASIPMADARHGQATFSVANVSGRRLRGRASVVPREGARPEWFAIGGSAEREFSPGGLEQYTVEIAIPPEAPPGDVRVSPRHARGGRPGRAPVARRVGLVQGWPGR